MDGDREQPAGQDELAAQIADLSPMAILVVGRDSKLRFANAALRELTGYDGPSLVGVDWVEHFVPAHDRDRVRSRLATLQVGDERHAAIRTVLTARGDRYFQWWDRVLTDSDGEVFGLLAVGQDATERLLADADLARTARQLQVVRRITGVGTASRDARTGRTEISEEARRIFEIDHDDRTDLLEQLVSRVHPDERDRAERSFGALRRGEVDDATFEGRIVTDDGRTKHIRWRATAVVGDDGPYDSTVAAIQDISEFREVEDELRHARGQLEEAQRIARVGSWTLEFATGELQWTHEIYRIFEVDLASVGNAEDIARILQERTHPADRQVVEDTLADVLERRSDSYDLVHRLLFPDGRVRWVRVQGSVAETAEGAPIRAVGTVQDVSEVRSREDELRFTRDQLEDAQEIARFGSWTHDLVEGKLRWSRELYRIFGVDPDDDAAEAVARSRVHPDDLPLLEATRQQALEGRGPYDLLHRVVLPDGGIRWVRARGRFEYSDTGEPVLSVGSAQEVTETVEQQAALTRTARELEEAQRIALIGSWTVDLATGERTWSRELFRILGMDPDRDEPCDEAFARLAHPDDVARMRAATDRALETREQTEVTVRLDLPDGEAKWVRVTGRFEFADDGRPTRSIGIVQDITASREAEERLSWTTRQLEEAQRLAQIGSWTHDLVSGTVECSAEVFRIFERDPEEFDGTFDAFRSMVHPDDRPLARREYRASVENRSHYDYAHRLLLPDGRVKYVRQRGRTEFADDGTPIRSIGTIQDVTAVALAQLEVESLNTDLETRIEQRTAELVRARDDAEAANRAKDLFLASMSHEMRTPLNAVLAFAQLLELDGRMPSDLAEHVSEIREGGQHLLRLVSDVLDLAKVESGRIDLDIAEVPLDSVSGVCITQLLPLALHHRVAVRAEPCLARLWVRADADRLRQVLVNLVSNGIKYNRPDGTVTIDGEVLPGGVVRISVADTGRGVPLDRLGELFEPFVRLGQERGRVDGSGIGLSIAQRLVESMGGRLVIAASSEAGSTFTVELPGGELGSSPSVGGAPGVRS